MTALGQAVIAVHVRVVRRLLQAGARENAGDKDGRTVVYWATRGNYAELLELLLECEADPNLSGEPETRLYEAANLLVWRGASRSAFWRSDRVARRCYGEQHENGEGGCGSG
jgi:ankyrin repeat protein